VEKGQTLWGISKAYGVGLAEIVEANDLDDYTIGIGQRLYIPGVSRTIEVAPTMPSAEEVTAAVGDKLAWPLAGRGRSSVTSGFGYRDDPISGGRKFHKGIDIDGVREERVLAAAGGEIVYAGRMSGFGNVVMIDHGNRLLTVYAHLSRSIVKLEDVVAAGQTIGYVGSSGRANGSHLHFEVRYKGKSVDPLGYLP
jgi:murein DD-endopeptidase MepM/ murein hydrolase activator NlpD